MSSSLTPTPSGAGRGDTTIQPVYFTSSLFVAPLRKDVSGLVDAYRNRYEECAGLAPYELFKTVWTEQGWSWLHLKILEPRARQSFLGVVIRLFLELVNESHPPIDRAAGLFALYTFYSTQPSASVPAVHTMAHIPIAIDQYECLLQMPTALVGQWTSLQPHVRYILASFVKQQVFYSFPPSSIGAQNPRTLPRELIHMSDMNPSTTEARDGEAGKKKVGRPSKAEKLQKAKSAVANLDKWLDKTTVNVSDDIRDPAGAAHVLGNAYCHTGQSLTHDDLGNGWDGTTHTLLPQRPMSSLASYREKKQELLGTPSRSDVALLHGHALADANQRVLARLKHIDALAAERGLEVGTEGGEHSGLERVERVVENMTADGKGLLGLLEGAGLRQSDSHDKVL